MKKQVISKMISAELVDENFGGVHCYNPQCPHDLKYHDKVLSTFFIKRDVVFLRIYFSSPYYSHSETYCRDCIDIVYQELRPILDSRLWPFC